MKNLGGVKDFAFKLLLGLFAVVCLIAVSSSTFDAETVNNKNSGEVGIEFKRTKDISTSSSTSSTSTNHEIDKPDPITKKGASLPQTGELAQPLIFLVIGILIIVVVVALYFSSKSNKKES